MAKNISKEEVAKTAKLARLALSSAEIDKFTSQLGSVLKNFSQVDAIETEGVKITAQVTGQKDVMVKDELDYQIEVSQKDLLANAPKSEDGFFIVPRILE